MKILLTTIALIVAAPVAAQTAAPAADPHAGHSMPADHGQHKDKDDGKAHDGCCDHKSSDGKKMPCCAEGKMDCCADKAAKGAADAHAGHDMSKH